MIDRLAMGDGEDPGAKVAIVLQAGVGAEGGDEGLLERILGVVGADGGHEETEHVRAMLVEQVLKGGEGLRIGHLPMKRLIPAFRETLPADECGR